MQPMSSHRTRFLHTPTRRFPGIALLAAGILLLQGCDQIYERAGFPDPARIEAEGKAIGGACRHAGRGLEDCYRLNKDASKSAVYAGWKEMNEYMVKNNMQAVTPSIQPESAFPARKKKKPVDDDENATTGSTEKKAKSKSESDTGKSAD
jgi:hypothetical protein